MKSANEVRDLGVHYGHCRSETIQAMSVSVTAYELLAWYDRKDSFLQRIVKSAASSL